MNNPLKWDVFVSSQIPAVTGELPPGATELKWSPISSTLVSGERDAVLVDTFITMEQNRELILLAPYGRTEAVASLGPRELDAKITSLLQRVAAPARNTD